jgi:hypothetical protein
MSHAATGNGSQEKSRLSMTMVAAARIGYAHEFRQLIVPGYLVIITPG